jgi:hypothetical protein
MDEIRLKSGLSTLEDFYGIIPQARITEREPSKPTEWMNTSSLPENVLCQGCIPLDICGQIAAQPR